MASIRKRAGRWQARVIRQGYPPSSKTFDTRQDAEKWGRSIEREMDRESYTDAGKLYKMTLGDLLKKYRKQVTPTKRGKRNEEYLLIAIEKHRIASINLAHLCAADLAEYRDERLREVTSGTAQRGIAIIVTESPRVLRRLQLLREWSHEQIEPIFPRSTRARSAHGARATQRAPILMGRH